MSQPKIAAAHGVSKSAIYVQLLRLRRMHPDHRAKVFAFNDEYRRVLQLDGVP